MPKDLEKAFEREYVGKKVPKKWQSKYGKVYSKKEADEIFFKWENKHGIK